MSPLGTLLVPTSSTTSNSSPNSLASRLQIVPGLPVVASHLHHHHHQSPLFYPQLYANSSDPLLRLMSLSLVREPGTSVPNNGSALAAAAAAAAAASAAAAALQFKPDTTSPTSPDDSPVKGGFSDTASTMSGSIRTGEEDNKDADEDDEVLSIGREDEDDDDTMVIDCDSSTDAVRVPSDKRTDNQVDDEGSNDNINNNNNNNPTSRESLMFSIANILRPDFGGPQQPLEAASPPPFIKYAPMTPIRKHHQTSHHHHSLHKKVHKSAAGQQNHSPIDLSSRPTNNNNGSNSNRNHHHRNGKNNHHQVSSTSTKPSAKLPSKATSGSTTTTTSDNKNKKAGPDGTLWPAWVYCTRYSDRPSSGRSPRTRRGRKKEKEIDEKRPRTAFTAEQLARLKREFEDNKYLTEKRRQDLAKELRLHENQIKIWFQNKRAKLKKANGQQSGLALQLMAQGLYNHSTIPQKGDEDYDENQEDSD